jgi:hypothetical protein
MLVKNTDPNLAWDSVFLTNTQIWLTQSSILNPQSSYKKIFFAPLLCFDNIFSVGNVGPKSDHVERSDLAKRFFTAGWERERAKREKQEGQGLKYPSVGLSMI